MLLFQNYLLAYNCEGLLKKKLSNVDELKNNIEFFVRKSINVPAQENQDANNSLSYIV
jgi:hypothetical protein